MNQKYTKEQLEQEADFLAGQLIKYLYSAKTKYRPEVLKKQIKEDIYKFLLNLFNYMINTFIFIFYFFQSNVYFRKQII